MALEAPQKKKRGLKILVYGGSGVGKTLFLLSFPKVAAIDMEDGMAHYLDNPNISFIDVTTSYKDVVDDIEDIEDEYFDQVNTIGIDSITKLYENLQHIAQKVAEKRARDAGRNPEGESLAPKDWNKIKQKYKELMSKLINLSGMGKNFVITAQVKDELEKSGDQFVKVGETFDAMKKADYDFDIVMQMYEEDGIKKGLIEKDRTNTYRNGDIIENPSYENWKKHIDEIANLQSDKVFKEDQNEVMKKDEEEFNSEEYLKDYIKKIKDEATNLKNNKVNVNEIIEIIGHEGKPGKIDNLEEAKDVLDKLQKRNEKVKQ